MRALLLGALLATSLAAAQTSWQQDYKRGLDAAKAGDWATARAAFQAADSARRGDLPGPINLPGPVTEPRRWRGGAPYSPRFGASYAGFRQALALSPSDERTALLRAVVDELRTEWDEGRRSEANAWLRAKAHSTMGDSLAADAAKAERSAEPKPTFRIDLEVLAPEERSELLPAEQGQSPSTNPSTAPIIKAEDLASNPGGTAQPTPVTTPTAQPTTPTAPAAQPGKYALLIGNTETRLLTGKVDSAANDAMLLRDTLVNSCGYPAENVDVITDATGEGMRAALNALAERITPGSTLMFFYSGPAVNLAGRDYLVGIDSELPNDSSLMLPLADAYAPFLAKGVPIFAFFQSHRRVDQGRYFGQEIPATGSIAQFQGTKVDGDVTWTVSDGRVVGVFASAVARVLDRLKAPRVPIREFAWAVFETMRGGEVGGASGGGSAQVPSLPVLRNLPDNASF